MISSEKFLRSNGNESLVKEAIIASLDSHSEHLLQCLVFGVVLRYVAVRIPPQFSQFMISLSGYRAKTRFSTQMVHLTQYLHSLTI
jgi:hypothetical protein